MVALHIICSPVKKLFYFPTLQLKIRANSQSIQCIIYVIHLPIVLSRHLHLDDETAFCRLNFEGLDYLLAKF